MTSYYASTEHLEAAITDVFAPVSEVVAEVERLCRREAHAAAYYREHPELIAYAEHPWWRFVATGQAAYLGWEPRP